MNLPCAAVLVVVAFAAPARAESGAPPPPPQGFLHELVADVQARIDAIIVARPPKLVPPKKVAVRWRLAKLGTIDLGAPLVALAGADLDGDGKGELYAVTTREVVALGLRGKKLEELGRVQFSGDHAIGAPRDVVGTAIVDGSAVVATVSSWTRGLRVGWKGAAGRGPKTLVGAAAEPGFLLCPGELAQLTPGRNYFGDATTGRYGVRCSSGLVEPDGRPIRVRAELSLANKLDVAVERCAAAGLGCQPSGHFEYTGVGVAFDVTDVDRDGVPEVIFAAAGAPGDADTLRVVSFGGDEKKSPKLKKAFTAGGIAGLATADLDGDGALDVIAAVRLVGATRVDLWRLE